MKYPYSKDTVPEGATHVWTEALNTTVPGLEPLAYYKADEDGWMVYSRHFGWRKSQNDPEWFHEESRTGIFTSL